MIGVEEALGAVSARGAAAGAVVLEAVKVIEPRPGVRTRIVAIVPLVAFLQQRRRAPVLPRTVFVTAADLERYTNPLIVNEIDSVAAEIPRAIFLSGKVAGVHENPSVETLLVPARARVLFARRHAVALPALHWLAVLLPALRALFAAPHMIVERIIDSAPEEADAEGHAEDAEQPGAPSGEHVRFLLDHFANEHRIRARR
jgi:hypothetical protein